MKKILLSLVTLLAVGSIAARATTAYFSDTETSTGNTFSAGSLDLTVDGKNGENVIKWTLTNLRPGNQPLGRYTLNNSGSVNGYLNLSKIALTSKENECLEPETGDPTCGATDPGELQDVLGFTLFWDNDCNNWVGTGDVKIYDGLLANVPASISVNRPLNAGASQCLSAQFNWWNTPIDNLAMSDGVTLDLEFDLTQNEITP